MAGVAALKLYIFVDTHVTQLVSSVSVQLPEARFPGDVVQLHRCRGDKLSISDHDGTICRSPQSSPTPSCGAQVCQVLAEADGR